MIDPTTEVTLLGDPIFDGCGPFNLSITRYIMILYFCARQDVDLGHGERFIVSHFPSSLEVRLWVLDTGTNILIIHEY